MQTQTPPRPAVGQRIGEIEVRAVSASHVVFAHAPATPDERLDCETRERFASEYLNT